MFITAKITKLSCFANTVLQPCLILDKLFTGRTPFLSPNEQCQSTEEKEEEDNLFAVMNITYYDMT